MQVDIQFDQLMKLVKSLPTKQLRVFEAEVDKKIAPDKPKTDLEALFLNGPVATKKQLETIENNRKAINQWRTT